MLILIGLLLFGLFLTSLILPWIHLTHIKSLRKEVDRLTVQVSWLISYAREKGADIPEQWEKLSQAASFKKHREDESKKKITEESQKKSPIFPDLTDHLEKAKEKVEGVPLKKKFLLKDIKKSFEQKFLLSLPVWIGGIALALAGGFLVKYSIEMGFLSPSVRIIIGILFGISLLVCGNWIHDRAHIANGKRISQALSGAGIADLYACLFAATSFYQLIPSFMGFVGMAVVTAIAVVLSLKQGPPIAMLGMIGGFLTPTLIESREPNAQLLFIYLYFVLAGLFTVIRRKNWWFMSIPVVLSTFAWVVFWLATSFSPQDSIWLGLFLVAVSATIVFHSKKAIEEKAVDKSVGFKLFPELNYLSMGGAILLMSVIAAKSNFGGVEWGLFGFLAAGGIVLAYYNQNIYGFIPWVSVLMNLIMLLSWQEPDSTILALTILGFALLYTISSYWLMWQGFNSRSWALLAAGSSLIYYVLAYAKFHNWVGKAVFFPKNLYTQTHLWGSLALGLFILSVFIIIQVLNRFKGEEDSKQYLLSIFTLTATAFLSIGLSLELNEEFLTIALVTEILVISWISGYVQIKALRPLAAFLSAIFGILIIPQILFQILALSNVISLKFTDEIYYPSGLSSFFHFKIPSISWTFFHLGLTAVMFGISSFLLRKEKDDVVVRTFEMIAIGLITVMTYYLIRHAFQIQENVFSVHSSFLERTTLTNIFFLYGLGCLWLGSRFNRNAVSLSGIGLTVLSLIRILFLDLLVYNPLWSDQYIGYIPVFNALLPSYGLPMLWLILILHQLPEIEKQKYYKYINICLFLLLFFFISFNVRQFYQGAYLDIDKTSSAEVYTYSVAWLLTGIGLLFFGTLKKNKVLRVASLAFITLAVAKVFLYDAAELTGLLRVFSFLGLGMSLLGLSWFYTRFVFNRLK
jgi:uncharacterized membrane protein